MKKHLDWERIGRLTLRLVLSVIGTFLVNAILVIISPNPNFQYMPAYYRLPGALMVFWLSSGLCWAVWYLVRILCKYYYHNGSEDKQ